jgi:hypothetical protein
MSEADAIAATMTVLVQQLDATATAQAEMNEGQPVGESIGEEPASPIATPLIVEDIPWCPAMGYLTHLPARQEVIYWPVAAMGKDKVIYGNFPDSIYQGEAIVPLDGDSDPNTLSLVYFKAQDDTIYQWKQMNTIEAAREEVYQSHLIMAPASDKLAFSIVRQNSSEVFVSSISAMSFAQPLLKASVEGSALDPVRMLLDDAGNLVGLYVTYVDDAPDFSEWFRYGRGLVYVNMASGEATDILAGDWIVLDVSETGRTAAIIDSLGEYGLVIHDVNQNNSTSVPLCAGCTKAGAALIRPDDGMVAWTEEQGAGESYLLRVADAAGNVIFEMDSAQATDLTGFEVDALQAKGWLTSGLLLVDSGFVKNQVFVVNIVTGTVEWKSAGNFLSLVYNPELCK